MLTHAASRTTPGLFIPLCSNQFTMPAQNRIRSYDRRHLLKHVLTDNLALDGQTSSLVIIEQDAIFAEFLPEHAILGSKILDDLLLSMIDPAGQEQEQQLPGLQKGLHTSPNAV